MALLLAIFVAVGHQLGCAPGPGAVGPHGQRRGALPHRSLGSLQPAQPRVEVTGERDAVAHPYRRGAQRAKFSLSPWSCHGARSVSSLTRRSPQAVAHEDFARAGFRPRVVQRGPTPQGLLALVAAGVGVTRLMLSSRSLRDGGVVFVPLAGEEARVVLVWREDAPNPILPGAPARITERPWRLFHAVPTRDDRERALRSIEAEPIFEVDNQLANTISNIGGSQTIYYGDRSRPARIGKVLAVLGLVLSVVGLALFVIVGVATTHTVLDAVHDGGAQSPYTEYVASGWRAAAGLLVGGLLMNRFARILIAR